MSQRYPVNAITHIHTAASNGAASEMDSRISAALLGIFGEDNPVNWSECFTRVERLVRLLDHPWREPPVGIIAVTDHQNPCSHTLPDDLLRAAANEPRLAVCGELACIDQDVDGEYRNAPEVLVYGAGDPVDGPYGPHYGISQALLDEIFDVCRVPGRVEIQTSRVLDFCAERGLACALAHPFDAHRLSLEACFDLISRARFVETVNGGFPAVSARIIQDLVAFQNRLIAGWRLAPETAIRFPLVRRLADRIVEQERGALHPWGGSDSHSHAFERVTMRFLAHRPDPTAGDLFRAMLDHSVEDLLLDGTFTIQGKPGSAMSVLDDVVRIVARNIWNIRGSIPPSRAWPLMKTAHRVVAQELGDRSLHRAEQVKEAGRQFPSSRVLAQMVPPAGRGRASHRWLRLVSSSAE